MSPRTKARIAGLFYLLTIVTGAISAMSERYRLVFNLVAMLCYVPVTLLFYVIFKPVNKTISLIAALFSLAGCALTAVGPFHLVPPSINPLAFFGVYCLLIGYLVFTSNFLPRFTGALMAIGGLGWLTFVTPSLAASLAPYNMAPGVLGETVLTIYLIAIGVNEPRWNERARQAGPSL